MKGNKTVHPIYRIFRTEIFFIPSQRKMASHSTTAAAVGSLAKLVTEYAAQCGHRKGASKIHRDRLYAMFPEVHRQTVAIVYAQERGNFRDARDAVWEAACSLPTVAVPPSNPSAADRQTKQRLERIFPDLDERVVSAVIASFDGRRESVGYFRELRDALSEFRTASETLRLVPTIQAELSRRGLAGDGARSAPQWPQGSTFAPSVCESVFAPDPYTDAEPAAVDEDDRAVPRAAYVNPPPTQAPVGTGGSLLFPPSGSLARDGFFYPTDTGGGAIHDHDHHGAPRDDSVVDVPTPAARAADGLPAAFVASTHHHAARSSPIGNRHGGEFSWFSAPPATLAPTEREEEGTMPWSHLAVFAEPAQSGGGQRDPPRVAAAPPAEHHPPRDSMFFFDAPAAPHPQATTAASLLFPPPPSAVSNVADGFDDALAGFGL